MDRREFLAKAGLAVTWAGVSISVAACSSDGDSGMNPVPPEGDVEGTIEANHGHTGAVVTEAQLEDGQAVELTIVSTGTGAHSHRVNLSAEQVMEIAAGFQVRVESNEVGLHTHFVTFN